jgi:hypothetical protein
VKIIHLIGSRYFVWFSLSIIVYPEDSDQAEFYYNNNYEPYTGYGPTTGFTDKDYLLSPNAIVFGDRDFDEPGDIGEINDDPEPVPQCDPAIKPWQQVTLPTSCRGVTPITNSSPFFDVLINGKDPAPEGLLRPVGCDLIRGYKVERKDFNLGNVLYGPYGFEVKIYEYDDYYGFKSNYPVMHVFAKGGSQDVIGNLYMYYFPEGDPLYPKGVTSDMWLSQPSGGDISHMSFYYCIPKPEPDINIKKYVFLGSYNEDGSEMWQHISDNTSKELLDGVDGSITPKFKIVVTNTGNVDLVNVVVTDNILDLNPNDDDTMDWVIVSLPKNSPPMEKEITPDQWWAEQLSTEDVVIELCNSAEHTHPNYIYSEWVPTGPQSLPIYFYHTEKILKNETIGLCVKVYLKNEADDRYNGSKFVLKSYFEAVQTTNGIIIDNWKNDLDKLGITDKSWLP